MEKENILKNALKTMNQKNTGRKVRQVIGTLLGFAILSWDLIGIGMDIATKGTVHPLTIGTTIFLLVAMIGYYAVTAMIADDLLPKYSAALRVIDIQDNLVRQGVKVNEDQEKENELLKKRIEELEETK